MALQLYYTSTSIMYKKRTFLCPILWTLVNKICLTQLIKKEDKNSAIL